MELLGSDSESDADGDVGLQLNTNNDYATRYDTWRGKEQLQKLKDKYGDDVDEDDESSEEESEDEEAGELTAAVERDFFTTLASLKERNPAIYDGKTEFFRRPDEGVKGKAGNKAGKKVTLADIERKVMLEKGGKFDEIEDGSIEKKEGSSYNEELELIKSSFKTALEDEEEGEDSKDDLLMKRTKTEEEKVKEEEDYREWLAGQKSQLNDAATEQKLKGLRDYWNTDDLNEGEKFLKDFILNKRYLEGDEGAVPSYEEVVHDSDENLSEDEANVAKQEEFEHKYNFRFEEPDEEFIKRYPRTIKDTMRKEEDKRKKKRKEVEERKKHEKEIKKEEIKMLKSMKKKEILDKLEKLKKITGNDQMELQAEDIDGDFDPEAHDKKMEEIFRNYDESAGADEEKPTFSDIEDEDYDAEDYGENFEDWDNWTGAAGEPEGEEEGPNCEEEGFNMDCDFQQEMVQSTSKKKGRRKSKFSEALEQNPSKPAFNPAEKTFSQYVEDYYKLDCEDIIGDLPCRFKYRDVESNDFGLSVEEVLAAPDRELNAWASLRKTCQYRSQEEEKKDVHVFRNKAKDDNLKKKILPTLFEETVQPTVKVEVSQEGGVATVGARQGAGRRKRKRKGKNNNTAEVKEENEKTSGADAAEELPAPAKKSKLSNEVSENTTSQTSESIMVEAGSKGERKRKKKKKKTKLIPQQTGSGSAIKVDKISGFFGQKGRSGNHTRATGLVAAHVSDERLKAYGVAPGQYKRRLNKEKYRR